MSSFKARIDRIYQPRPAPWKRPVLFWLSTFIGLLCAVGGWMQLQHHWTNDGVWLAIAFFGVLSAAGIGVALFGDDWWVALMLGRI